MSKSKRYLELHADGVKELEGYHDSEIFCSGQQIVECPFCKPDFCEEPHCPYTEEED